MILTTTRKFLTAIVACLLPCSAQAGIISTPPDLNPGDTFRIVFVTSNRDIAIDDNIGNYDNFVTAAAAAGSMTSLTYNGSPITWQVIGSTANKAANASDRLPVTSTAPIYRVDGIKVANGGADLWDGSISAPINLSENGSAVVELVWTGTNIFGDRSEYFLGNPGPVSAMVGAAIHMGPLWVQALQEPKFAIHHFYAVSSPLVAVPEPSTWALIGTVALGLIAWAVKVKRRPCGIVGPSLG